MESKVIILTEAELTDIYQGLVIAMKELDFHSNAGGSDGKLADRLEVIVKKIEKQSKEK